MENKQRKFEETKDVNTILQELREKRLRNKVDTNNKLATVIEEANRVDIEEIVQACQAESSESPESIQGCEDNDNGEYEEARSKVVQYLENLIENGTTSYSELYNSATEWSDKLPEEQKLFPYEIDDFVTQVRDSSVSKEVTRHEERAEIKRLISRGFSRKETEIELLKWNSLREHPIPESSLRLTLASFSPSHWKKMGVIEKKEIKKYGELSKAIIDIDDFLKIEFPERKMIISPWLKEQSITLISGWRGSGKTFFSLTLALCAVGGLNCSLSKWNVINTVPTLYIDAEMVGDDIQKRIHKLETDVCNKEKLFIYSDHYANLQGLPPARLGDAEWRQVIRDLILENKIKLVFLDNISALCPEIDENLKHIWGPINSWLLELRYAGVASVLDHHTGKKGDQRGISGREDSIDNSILLNRPLDYSDKDGCKFNLHFTKCRGVNDADRRLIPDTEFWLKDEDEFHSSWECGTVSKKKFVEGVHMLSSGMSYTQIAKELGIKSKSTVSDYFIKAVEKGYLTKEKKLTESGRTLVRTLPEYNNNWQETDEE